MAGKTSGWLEESRYDGSGSAAVAAARSSRRQGSEYGQTGARSKSSKSGSRDDTTNKSGLCRAGGACKSPATAITEPASEINNGLREGNNSNGASNTVGSSSSNNNNRPSYSKIFRQYLPSSLNLNYTPGSGGIKSKRAAGELVSKPNADEEEEELRQRRRAVITTEPLTTETRAQQVESGQSRLEVAKSIASALSRFRISSNSVKDKQANDSLLDSCDKSNSFQRANRAKRLSEQDINNNNNNEDDEELLERQVKVQFDLGERAGEQQRREEQRIAEKEQRVKRKGFLYLKRISKGGREIAPIAGQKLRTSQASPEESDKKRTAPAIGSRKYLIQKDPNNNSISSLLSSQSNGRHDEHTACLLDEQEDDEEDMFGGVERAKQTADRRSAATTITETRAAKKQTMSTQSNKAKPRTSKQGHLLARSLMAAFLIGFAALLASVALAQQQQMPPASFRSQPSQQAQPVAGVPVGSGPAGRAPSAQPAPLPQPVAGSLVANINCNKIRGHVTLTPNLRGGTTVSTQISAGPPGEVYQWSVHQFPVKPGAAMCSCSALILGTKLIDLSEMHGNLPSDQEFNVQSSLNLFGAESPVGHSLMLRGMKTGMVACATFLPTR